MLSGFKFDEVCIDGMIFKLQTLELPIYLTTILTSFLKDGRFFIQQTIAVSDLNEIKAGVPNGAILSPTLFNIYTTYVPQLEGSTMFLYADDTTVFSKRKDPGTANRI